MSNKNTKTLNLDSVNLARQQALKDGMKPTVSLLHNTIGGNTGAIGALLSELSARDDRAMAAFDLPDEILLAGLSGMSRLWSEAVAQNGVALSAEKARLEALSADRTALQAQFDLQIAENSRMSGERQSLQEQLAVTAQKLAALEINMDEMHGRHAKELAAAAEGTKNAEEALQALEKRHDAAQAAWTERERALTARLEEAQKTAEQFRAQFETYANRILDRVGTHA